MIHKKSKQILHSKNKSKKNSKTNYKKKTRVINKKIRVINKRSTNITKKNKITRKAKKKTKLNKLNKMQYGSSLFKTKKIDQKLLLNINQRAQYLVNMKIQELNENFKSEDNKYGDNTDFNLQISFVNSYDEKVNISELCTNHLELDDFRKIMKFKLNSNVNKFKYKKVGDLFKDIYIKMEFEVTLFKKHKMRNIYLTLYDFYKKIKRIRPQILNIFVDKSEFIDKEVYKKNTLSPLYKRYLEFSILMNMNTILKVSSSGKFSIF